MKEHRIEMRLTGARSLFNVIPPLPSFLTRVLTKRAPGEAFQRGVVGCDFAGSLCVRPRRLKPQENSFFLFSFFFLNATAELETILRVGRRETIRFHPEEEEITSSP